MEDFIELYRKSSGLVSQVFNDIKNKIVSEAFKQFLNIDPNIVAEYLAKFLDFHLKKTSQDDEQLARLVEEVLTLFKLCNAKDVFEEFYMRGLSRRLLLKKSSSNESERQMLTKLRSECSNDFNSKCENMIKDLFDSDQFMVEYKKVHPQNQE